MRSKTRLERALGVLSDVRHGEGLRVVGMVMSLFVLMLAYYLLKTLREPLILASGGAEVKSYAAGMQAVLLIGCVPLYAWLSRRVGRRGLIIGLVGFFFANLELFYLALHAGVRYTGVAFFVWVGIFSLSVIAQFWSLANDLYSQDEGERLFPIIAFGATAGSPIGARIAGALFRHGLEASVLIQLAALLLLVHGALTLALVRPGTKKVAADQPVVGGSNGLQLIFQSRYLMMIAALFMLLNVVNTLGEYVLGKNVVSAAVAAVAAGQVASKAQFIGAFYGSFFFWVNVIAALVQALLVSRVVKRFGIRGVLLFLPVLAFGVYATLSVGVGFAALRWLKTAENAADYSIMNTGRAMLWLPTTREQKYRAKQTLDTLFVRLGDVLATGVVATTAVLKLSIGTITSINVVLAALWILVAWRIATKNQRISRAAEQTPRSARGSEQVVDAIATSGLRVA